MQSWTLRVLFLNLLPWCFKQDDAERQGRDSSAERVEPDKVSRRVVIATPLLLIF